MKRRTKNVTRLKNIELCIVIIHMIWFNTYRWFTRRNPLLVSVNHFFFSIDLIRGLSSLLIFRPFSSLLPRFFLFETVGKL